MTTYFDPITQVDTDIDVTTLLYLVRINTDLFAIKGISAGIERLLDDPATQAREYWLIDSEHFVSNYLNDPILCANGKLRSEPVTHEEVLTYFNLDLQVLPATPFNSFIIGQQIVSDGEHDIITRICDSTPDGSPLTQHDDNAQELLQAWQSSEEDIGSFSQFNGFFSRFTPEIQSISNTDLAEYSHSQTRERTVNINMECQNEQTPFCDTTQASSALLPLLCLRNGHVASVGNQKIMEEARNAARALSEKTPLTPLREAAKAFAHGADALLQNYASGGRLEPISLQTPVQIWEKLRASAQTLSIEISKKISSEREHRFHEAQTRFS